jgi:pimeloyl-ACP methyl ester carboxylesterase
MKTSLQRIHTSDGVELVGLLYEPEASTEEILVHVHGMGGNFYENKFLDYIAATLTKSGVACLFFNNRGCETIKDLTTYDKGKRSLRRVGNAYERFEDCLLDIEASVQAVIKNGYTSIHLCGHSLGTSKVAYYAAQSKEKNLRSLLLLSPSDMHGLVRKKLERFKEDVAETKALIAAGNGDQFLTKKVWDEYFISANSYQNLFIDSADAIFNFLDPTVGFHTLENIALPLFAVMGKKDDALVIPIEQTMEYIKIHAKSSPKVKTTILGDADHGFISSEQALADAILLWIEDN